MSVDAYKAAEFVYGDRTDATLQRRAYVSGYQRGQIHAFELVMSVLNSSVMTTKEIIAVVTELQRAHSSKRWYVTAFRSMHALKDDARMLRSPLVSAIMSYRKVCGVDLLLAKGDLTALQKNGTRFEVLFEHAMELEAAGFTVVSEEK